MPKYGTALGVIEDGGLLSAYGTSANRVCFVLNSEYAAYYFLSNVAVLDKGGFRMFKQYVENIPIPDISKIDCEEDVYTAFGFSDDEITFIKSVVARRKEEIVNGAD